VENFCRQSGLDVVFTTFDYQPGDRFPSGTVPRIIREHSGAEGVLLAGTNYPNFLEHLHSLGLPYVYFGNNLVTGSLDLPTEQCVCFDEREGGEKAAAFLAELGHRAIRFVGDLSKPWYQRRYEGYVRALSERGLEPVTVDIRDTKGSFELGQRAAGVLIHRHRGTTAVLAQDDETACGMLDGFRRIGVRVPGDISLMGYDDITEIQYLNPSLTTVRVRKEEIGTTMAAELVRLREGGKKTTPAPVLATEIVVRDSCSKAPEPLKAVS
jgi:LacI family transcriptional regulator